MLKQKLHPFEFLLLPLLGLVSIFSVHIWQGYLLTLLLMALNLVILNSQVKLKKLAVFSLILLPALGAMFASSYWFAPADGLNMLTGQNNSHQQLIQSANLTLCTQFFCNPSDTITASVFSKNINNIFV